MEKQSNEQDVNRCGLSGARFYRLAIAAIFRNEAPYLREWIEFHLSHFVHYKPGYYQVNTDRVRFEGRNSPYIQADALRIHHYQLRDEHYLRTKKIPRVLKWWNAQPAEKWLALYNSYNQVQDLSVHKFVPRLYSRMIKC